MTENKAAAKDLAERHVKAVAAWHAAAIKVRECEAAAAKARDELDIAQRQMDEADSAFTVALGLAADPLPRPVPRAEDFATTVRSRFLDRSLEETARRIQNGEIVI